MLEKVKNEEIICVGSGVMEKVLTIAPVYCYDVHSFLYYENQTPLVAYFIKSGKGKLFRRGDVDIPFGPGNIIGLKELMKNEPSYFGAELEAGSSLIYLDRSTIYEIIGEGLDKELKAFFEERLPPVKVPAYFSD